MARAAMKYVFGPVPSRRLGRSLGVDPVPLKACNWNCVYCQLGRAAPSMLERQRFFPPEEILAEVSAALAELGPEGIDWVTFVGSGETTLSSDLGMLIQGVKELTRVPVAVITNGSLFSDVGLRRELLAADAVIPSLDAGSEELYRRIDRPAKALGFEAFLEGLITFRREYQGRLWIEVMLVRGLNDGDEALADIARALARVRPDRVHINLPSRAPAEPWVEAPEPGAIERARALLGVEAESVPVSGALELGGRQDLAEAISEIVRRHPISEAELLAALSRRWGTHDVSQTLEELVAGGRVQLVERLGKRFWTAKESRFPAAKTPASGL